MALNIMKLRTLILTLTSTALSFSAAHAQVLAVQTANNSGGGPFSLNADTTYGWSFSLNSPVSVTDLGYYDHQSDGLIDLHTIGIWNSNGDLLAQEDVPAGTGANLQGSYRFSAITPVALSAGQTYFIGGWAQNANDGILAFTSETYASEVNYDRARNAPTTGFQQPTGDMSFVNQGVFGPNFIFTPVPEPHEYALVAGTGLLAFGLVRRRMMAHQN